MDTGDTSNGCYGLCPKGSCARALVLDDRERLVEPCRGRDQWEVSRSLGTLPLGGVSEYLRGVGEVLQGCVN